MKAAEGPDEPSLLLPLLCNEADNKGNHSVKPGPGHVSLVFSGDQSHVLGVSLEPRAEALPSPASQSTGKRYHRWLPSCCPGGNTVSRALVDVASMNASELLLMSFWPPWFAMFWDTRVWTQVKEVSCSQMFPSAASLMCLCFDTISWAISK